MNYEEFKDALYERLETELKERGIDNVSLRTDMLKSPDGVTERLIVSAEGSAIAMAFRYEAIYDRFKNMGEDIGAEVAVLMENIKENLIKIDDRENDVKDFIMDYENVKDHLLLRLVPGNSPILDETHHNMIEDMALVVNIDIASLSDDNGRAVVVVNDGLMGMYGINKEKLFADAARNSLEQEPINIKPMMSVISHMVGNEGLSIPEEDRDALFIATNESGFHGAAVLGYPGFMDMATEAMNGSFYLIPSSVHEFILIKDDGNVRAQKLNAMIKDVNENVLSPREILSDQCYHYDAKTKVLENGLKYDRTKEKKVGVR